MRKDYFENIETAGAHGHRLKRVYSNSCFICNQKIVEMYGACGAGNFEMTSPEVRCGSLCADCNAAVLQFMRDRRDKAHPDHRMRNRDREEKKKNGR